MAALLLGLEAELDVWLRREIGRKRANGVLGILNPEDLVTSRAIRRAGG